MTERDRFRKMLWIVGVTISIGFMVAGFLAPFVVAFCEVKFGLQLDKANLLGNLLLAFIAVGPAAYLTGLAVIVPALVVLQQIKENRRLNEFNQSIVAIMHCNSRYDEIVRNQPPNTPSSPAKAKQHWRRYWGIKADQFDLYLTGLIDRDTMASWQLSIIRHFLRDLDPEETVRGPGGISAIKGWTELGRSQNETNFWFSELVDRWYQKGKEIAEELNKLNDEVRARQLDAVEKADRRAQILDPKKLLTYVLEQLEDIEPLVRAWRRSSKRGNMSFAFYRASLEWELFPQVLRSAEQTKYLEKLQNGVAITPLGVILGD